MEGKSLKQKIQTPKRGNTGKRQNRGEWDRMSPNNHLIPGFHAVRETLCHRKNALREIWISEGKRSGRTEEILHLAKAQNIPVHFKENGELSAIFGDISHQGVVGVAKAFAYTDVHQVMHHSLGKGPSALLLAADHITDEGNLGALIRTAAFFGVHGLIIPKDRSAQVTATVLKRASGAHLRLPVARVTNLGRALDDLSEKGFWIIGAAGEANLTVYNFDWNQPVVLVLGSEQRGLSLSARKQCHQLVRIPSPGAIESLNISVAGGVILSEICRQRQR